MNKLYGLVGIDLRHSFSKDFFDKKFKKENLTNHEYRLFPLKGISLFPLFLERHHELNGFNVTIPYKKNVLFFLDDIDPVAELIGAVNVVKVLKHENQREYIGFNTDTFGFEKSLTPLLQPHHSQALILGTGGAAQAVAFVLKNIGINFRFVSRSPINSTQLPYSKLNKEIIQKHPLIINTTPVGTALREEDILPFPFEYLLPNHLLYDLIYNPEKTPFLKEGEKQGAHIKNGLEMLHLQAEKSWAIWNNDLY